MDKKTLKIIYIIIIVLICISVNLFCYKIYGTDTINPDNYQPNSTTKAIDASRIQKIANIIIGVLHVVGTVLSVAVLVVLGIKYMMGTVEEKANYKQSMTPYIIGAVMVFAITNILKPLATLFSSLIYG